MYMYNFVLVMFKKFWSETCYHNSYWFWWQTVNSKLKTVCFIISFYAFSTSGNLLNKPKVLNILYYLKRPLSYDLKTNGWKRNVDNLLIFVSIFVSFISFLCSTPFWFHWLSHNFLNKNFSVYFLLIFHILWFKFNTFKFIFELK